MLLYRRIVTGLNSKCVISLQRLLAPIYIVNTLSQRRVSEKHHTEDLEVQGTSVASEVQNYLKDSDVQYFIDNIPKKLLRKQCSANTPLYLVNPNVAKELSLMISKDLLENTSFVIKCNPGLGLLTKELLDSGVPSIYLYEKNDDFTIDNSPLRRLMAKHKDKLHLRQKNFFKVWQLLLNDMHLSQGLADMYLDGAPCYDWSDKSFAQIIAVCGRPFLACMIHNFFNQTSIFSHGRPTFFLILPAKIWLRFEYNKDSKSLCYNNQWSMILNLFFEFKCLGQVPRKAFVPWPKIKSDYRELDAPMLVVKLEPKKNAFHLIDKDDLKDFWYFTKYCMRSKKIAIIAEFEKLVPGCGPKLIRSDFDVLTKFKELTPSQMLKLFQNFREWPEYNPSLFAPSVNLDEEIKKEDDKVDGDEDNEKEASEMVTKESEKEVPSLTSNVHDTVKPAGDRAQTSEEPQPVQGEHASVPGRRA